MLTLRKHELKGHDVFEFMQGELLDDHWLDNSIYLTEEVLNETQLIEAFNNSSVNFNYYGPTVVNKETWECIKQEVLTSKSIKTQKLLLEIDTWAKICFKNHHCFTICGI
ncbi:hypothetical protein ACN9MH_21135 [Paenibacillus silvae]|uniref:hypothetical protein n=1 Tax=Paenibacillus TaxID=44249 RepID=UPI001C0FE8E5|nr:hypothetical protein [Paenibacillus barcinonensis]MBU5354062.1 hypothetical protein [Paenibacillus barcinonensis]